MNAVVLAGGVRSGREVPGSGLPRALWPFPNMPLISHVLAFLRSSGCERIAVCANGKTKMIASQLSSGATPWLDLHYSEDPLPRGPAGCLRDLQEWLGEHTFLAIQGTGLYDFDLQAMLDDHRSSGAAITVGARICRDDAHLLEPIGVYLIEPQTLGLVQSVGFQDIKEQFIPKVVAAELGVRCHIIKGTATLIHSQSHYLSAIGGAILRAADRVPTGYTQRAPGVIVHDSAQIHPTARLTGPLWLDANTVIEEHAVVAGPVMLAQNSRIRGHALVHRAVLMEGATAGIAAEVLSTVVAPNTTHAAEPAHHIAALAPPGRGFAAPLWERMDRFFGRFNIPRSTT